MFSKLKLKLTLINLSLIGMVLVVIFVGIYISMRRSIEHDAGIMMAAIARDEGVRPLPDFMGGRKLLINYFFAKTDKNGDIQEMSTNIPLSREDTMDMVGIAKEKKYNKGFIEYKNYSLRYLKEYNAKGSIIVFMDKSIENDMLKKLIIISLIIGGISLVLVFMISLYLAEKTLVPVKMAWEKQKNFAADASHELRTPLTVINTNLELVLDSPKDTVENQNKWLRNMQWEINRLSKLINDLLFLARADSGEEEILKGEFDLSNTMCQTISVYEPFIKEQGMVLKADIESKIMFYGNEGRIKQLFAIFLDNAIKYTNKLGEISLKLKKSANIIEITISDTGEGIEKEHLSKIFERFFRADKSRTRDSGGSGLGLAIAHCIIKEHNGSISVTSDIGQGTVFRIVFPNKIKG